jgi:hypothetical protein
MTRISLRSGSSAMLTMPPAIILRWIRVNLSGGVYCDRTLRRTSAAPAHVVFWLLTLSRTI